MAGTFTTSPDASEQVAGQLRYRRPIGDDGVIGTLAGTITRGEPGSTLAAFGVNTNSWAVGPRLTWPIIRTRAESLQLDGGFTFQKADIDVLGSRVAHDKWRVLDANVTYLVSNWLGGSWLATAGIVQGVPGLGASDNLSADLSRKGAYIDFTKLTGLVRYVGYLPDGFSVVLSGQGQFSFVPLINGELISFGGMGIGRGYDPGAITGDRGIGGSAELRYDTPFASKYVLNAEPYVYFDGGQTWYIQRGAAIDPSLIDQSIDSVGGGVRLTLPLQCFAGTGSGADPARRRPAATPARKRPSSLSPPASGSEGEGAMQKYHAFSSGRRGAGSARGRAGNGRARRSGQRHGGRSLPARRQRHSLRRDPGKDGQPPPAGHDRRIAGRRCGAPRRDSGRDPRPARQ